MKSIKYILLALSLTVASFFVGCVGPGNQPTDDPASPTGDLGYDRNFKLATKIATSELYIKGDVELAAELDSLIERVKTFAQAGEVVSPEAVDNYIFKLIAESSLQPASKQRLYTLATVLREQYLINISTDKLDAGAVAPLLTVLGWVQETAQETIEFGGQPVYPELESAAPLASSAESPGGLFYFITGARDWDSLVVWWNTPITAAELDAAIEAQANTGGVSPEFEMWARKQSL
jgi:hypothetical protein